MGLCKCPQRKVTNQFCFEHRVNVCEHCMVNRHQKCVVQSYLAWLQDSDYSAACEFCRRDLKEDACVRLACYHVVHWACLDSYARSLPADTAPAGFLCPACAESIFPPDNLVSPVADALRKTMSEVNWARAGLGLKLLEERVERRPEFSTPGGGGGSRDSPQPPSGPRPNPEGGTSSSIVGTHSASDSSYDTATIRHTQHKSDHAVSLPTSPLLLDGARDDVDDDKYKRRSATELLFRWLRSVLGPVASKRRRQTKGQRLCMTALLVIIAVATFVAVLSYLAGDRSGGDPMLEPMNNPNIRVGAD